MKLFIRKLLLYFIPVYFFVLLYILTDPFKQLYSYADYYSGNNFVSLNRSVINTKTYLRNREKEHYNAFIFGSSRTLAVKCSDWVKYLPASAHPFHFDANAEGLYGINRKIRFIDSHMDTIKYALIFVDQMLLAQVDKNEGILYADHPAVSGDGWLGFELQYLKAFINPRFFSGYFVYRLTGTYRSFMGSKILNNTYPDRWDPISSDLYLGFEKEIASDSAAYFKRLAFMADMKNTVKPEVLPVTEKERELLQEIKTVFEKHGTQYRIISNPFISEFPLCAEQKQVLEEIFGKENVYDFSGKSRFSSEIDNFYDPSHFRPKVAREILREIYLN
ncbi:MAG: hypothetical protein ACOYXB_09625 [Bacteroidota bacterium]